MGGEWFRIEMGGGSFEGNLLNRRRFINIKGKLEISGVVRTGKDSKSRLEVKSSRRLFFGCWCFDNVLGWLDVVEVWGNVRILGDFYLLSQIEKKEAKNDFQWI